MKRILRLFLTLLMLVVWASGFAAEKTYSYTFKSGDFSAKKKTSSLNGVNWKLATTCTKFGFDTQYSRGFAIGSGQVNPKNPVYSTSEISGTIKEITVNAACNANKSVDLEVTVNNVAYSTGSTSSTKVALTKSSTNYTFTGGASGEIKIKYTTSDKTAVYIKSIKVIYEDGPTKTLKSLAISGDATKKAYNDGEEFDPTGLVVTGTYDDASTAAITDGITWAKTPAKLAVGNTSCSVTATVNGVTSPAYKVTGLTVTKASAVVFDFTGNWNGVTPQNVNNNKTAANVLAGKELVVDGIVMTATNGKSLMTCLYGDEKDHNLRVYDGGSITFTAPEGYNISEVTFKYDNKSAKFTATVGTYSNGTWTGNVHAVTFNAGGSVKLNTATIKLVAVANPTLTLDENAEATVTENALSEAVKAGKAYDVTLTRTLTAGVWNTICLPFDVTAEQIANVLKSAGNVKEYGSEDVSKQTIYFKDATTMVAGKPYLIKPTESAKELVFKGVKITAKSADASLGSDYGVFGTFGKYAMKTDGTELFLKTDGKFYVPAEGKETMKGFRAYFLVPTSKAGAALNLSFGDATGINGVAADAEKNVKVYNVNGQYVGTSLEALPKGLYIVGGKKVLK